MVAKIDFRVCHIRRGRLGHEVSSTFYLCSQISASPHSWRGWRRILLTLVQSVDDVAEVPVVVDDILLARRQLARLLMRFFSK